jgi:hypothetical protein
MALLETCAHLYLAARHAELLAAVAPQLDGSEQADPSRPSHVSTALWSLAGLSSQALGDETGTRKALDLAAQVSSQPVWQGCPPHLASLALPLAQRFLERAERAAEGSEDRIVGPRLAAFWLRWRLVAAPGDTSSLALLDDAREALSAGYWDVVASLIGRREFAAARARVQEGTECDELPAARAEALLELLWTQMAKELERLTGPAIRPSGDETAAVESLERAEALLHSIPDKAIPPQHRTPMARRVWRGYARLGIRQLRSGGVDAAVETLLHALAMRTIDRGRQRQVREALVQTLETLGGRKQEAVERFLGEGNRSAAVGEVEDLIRRIQRAREHGLSQEQLTGPTAKARALAERLEQAGAP